jgi:hypothetical protein
MHHSHEQTASQHASQQHVTPGAVNAASCAPLGSTDYNPKHPKSTCAANTEEEPEPEKEPQPSPEEIAAAKAKAAKEAADAAEATRLAEQQLSRKVSYKCAYLHRQHLMQFTPHKGLLRGPRVMVQWPINMQICLYRRVCPPPWQQALMHCRLSVTAGAEEEGHGGAGERAGGAGHLRRGGRRRSPGCVRKTNAGVHRYICQCRDHIPCNHACPPRPSCALT